MGTITKYDAELAAKRMIAAVNRSTFEKGAADLAALSHKVYDTYLGDDLKIIEAAPLGHYSEFADRSFRMFGETHILKFGGVPYGFTAGLTYEAPRPTRRVRAMDESGSLDMDKITVGINVFLARVKHQIEAYAGMEILMAQMKSDAFSATGTIRALRTLKRIQDQWPEIVPYLPASVFDTTPSTALVVNREALNTRFGLPVEEVAP